MKKKVIAVHSQIKQILEKIGCGILYDDEKTLELGFTVNVPSLSEMVFSYDPERGLITLNSELALKVNPEYEKDFAVFVCVLNEGTANGSFDCVDESVYFRITSCVLNKTVEEDVITNMINKAVNTVKANFDILEKAANGLIPIYEYSKPAEKEAAATDSDIGKYHTLCSTLDKLDWNYNKKDDELSVTFDVLCEDIPMRFILTVDPREKNLVMLSPLPFIVTDESFYNIAYAASVVSSRLYDGTFCYNMASRELLFKMNMSYFEGEIDTDVFMYMVSCAISTVEMFNDKFFELNNGRFTIESFLKNMYEF